MKFRLTAPPEDKEAFAAVHRQWNVLLLVAFVAFVAIAFLFNSFLGAILPIGVAAMGFAHVAQTVPRNPKDP